MKRDYTPSKGYEAPKKGENKPKSVEALRRTYTPSVNTSGDGPSKTDKVLGALQGVIEKGGGSTKPLAQYLEESEGMTQGALDLGYGVAQGATFNHADEIYGGVRALLEDGSFENYETHRDEARDLWKEARERSPMLTTGGEVVGAMFSPASKVLAPAKGLRGVLRGAAEGAVHASGASEGELGSRQHLTETAVGAGIGGATGAVANVLTKGYKKEPDALRAEVTGTRPKDWKVSGPGDRRSSVQRLKETGFYKRDKVEFDENSLTFKPVRKSKFRLDEMEKNTEDRLLGRAQEAVNKIQKKKEQEFGKLLSSRRVSGNQITRMAAEIMDEYADRGLLKGPYDRDKIVLKVIENISDQINRLGDDIMAPSLATIDRIKRMAQEDVKNFSKSLAELGDNEELMRITSRKLKELVEDNLGSSQLTERFRKYNGAQHDFLNMVQDLKNQISKLDLAPNQRIQLEKSNFAERFVDSVTGGSDGKLMRAEIGDMVRKIPEPIRAATPYAAQEVPGTIYRQQFQGKNQTGRRPQSVDELGVDRFGGQKEFNIPEQLIRTPLPRTTNEFMEKKDFVLMKVAQMAPERYELFEDVYNNDPEMIPELMPKLIQMAPHLFARDKYDRFDGRVLTEAGRNRAMKDTLSREDLNSIQKAKIISKLNKDGIFEE